MLHQRACDVLVDTNILLLYFVGSFDRNRIPDFKRTKQFAVEDFDCLRKFLSRYRNVVTMPHILSEVNSLSGQLGEPARTKFFAEFATRIRTLDEQYVPSSDASEEVSFPKLGLTDSAILHLAGKGGYRVLTDDFTLYGFLTKAGVDVVNFNHLRHWRV